MRGARRGELARKVANSDVNQLQVLTDSYL